MTNSDYVVTICVFEVKKDRDNGLAAIRQSAREIVKGLPGFLGFDVLTPVDGQTEFADILKWDTLENV